MEKKFKCYECGKENKYDSKEGFSGSGFGGFNVLSTGIGLDDPL